MNYLKVSILFKKTAIPLFFFLFFLLSFSNAFAYHEFSYNSKFTVDNYGVYAFRNETQTYSWNETCFGEDGCFFAENSAIDTYNKIYIGNNNTIGSFVYTNESSINPIYTYISIPSYKDIFLSLSYYTNSTIYRGNPYYSSPYLFVVQEYPSYFILNSTILSGIEGQWNNYTVFIPYSTGDRQIVVYIDYSTSASPTLLAIDKFKLYTYDIDEARTNIFTTIAEENQTYCGDDKLSSLLFGKENTSLLLSYMMLNNTEGNNKCCVIQNGNITFGRACTRLLGGACTNVCEIWQMRDIVFLEASTTNTATKIYMLLKKLNAHSMLYSIYGGNNCTTSATYMNQILFNGANNFSWTNISALPCLGGDKIDATLDLSSYDLSGTKFTNYWIHNNDANTYISFPNYISRCDNVGWFCSAYDNRQYYVSSDCSISPSSITDCGVCGCGETYCNSIEGSIGTQCLGSDVNQHLWTTTIYDTATCGINVTMGTCGMWICKNDTIKTISCYNDITNTTLYYVNENGTNSTTSSSPLLSSSLYTNPFNYLAIAFGSLFGMGSADYLYYTVPMLAITLSLIVGFIGLYLGLHSKKAGEIFALSFLGTLTVLTFGLNNISLWALYTVIIIMSAGIMTGFFRKIIGGG